MFSKPFSSESLLKHYWKNISLSLLHNRVNKETTCFHASDTMSFSQRVCNEAHDKKKNRTGIWYNKIGYQNLKKKLVPSNYVGSMKLNVLIIFRVRNPISSLWSTSKLFSSDAKKNVETIFQAFPIQRSD